MNDYRRRLCAAVTAIPMVSALAAEPRYPAKPVRVLVGIAPGGAVDTLARSFAQKAGAALGKPFVVDNRSGAGGLIAYQSAVTAAPDGYTLLVATPAYTIATALENKDIDLSGQTAPLSLLTKAPFLLVVTPSIPPKSVQELIAYAKSRPNEFVMAGAGGSAVHMGELWLSYATQSHLTIVTYKGANPALVDLLAGQVHSMLQNVLTATPLVKSGRLRALAVTSLNRTSAMPDLPTIAESGVPGYDVTTWNGWLAPRGTPPAIVATLNRALIEAAAAPDIAGRLAADGGSTIGSTPAELARHMSDEVARWRKVAKSSGLKPGAW